MKRKKQYNPARDNPLVEYTPLLIAGAATAAAGVGYVVYKMSQPSSAASNTSPTKAIPSKTPKATPSKTPSKMPTPVNTTPAVNTTDPTTTTPAATILSSGQSMSPGDYLVSPNGNYKLIFQTDGNFVLYQGSNGSFTDDPSTAVWSTSTQNKGATTVIMQADGNLVLYVGTSAAWATNTAGNPGVSGVAGYWRHNCVYCCQSNSVRFV
jgi:hypothetical protein